MTGFGYRIGVFFFQIGFAPEFWLPYILNQINVVQHKGGYKCIPLTLVIRKVQSAAAQQIFVNGNRVDSPEIQSLDGLSRIEIIVEQVCKKV